MKLEQVVEALNRCTQDPSAGTCAGCSYENVGDTFKECCMALMFDCLEALKAQEPIEARLHLCESCAKEVPECDATVDGIEFGCGVGNDNVIGCTAYVNRWKAQEPVKPVVDIDTWKCGNCGHTLEHQELLGDNVLFHEQYNYCPECGKPVKWE